MSAYAVYTRSLPGDSDCKADQRQYRSCLDFARHFRLGNAFQHYSDTLKLTDDGAVNGIENLLDDIRYRKIKGVIVEETDILSENTLHLVRMVDFFASHQVPFWVVKETIPCPIKS